MYARRIVRQSIRARARVVVWSLALVMAVFAARYFLDPPPLLTIPVPDAIPKGPELDAAMNVGPHLYAHHRALLLTHIACGIAAIVLGLFQFAASLRHARPGVHRTIGSVYCTAVWIGGAAGLPLSFFILDAGAESVRAQFYPVILGFASLSIAWPLVTAMAFLRAKQRRFDGHRAWMLRSYSLTFAAVTTRLAGPLLLAVTRDVTLSVQVAILIWPLNLVAAEWLIRRGTVHSDSIANRAAAERSRYRGVRATPEGRSA